MSWLDQVAADVNITSAGFRLAYILAGYINRTTGLAWPTQETLARVTGLTDRTVRSLTADLIKGGHIECKNSRGRHRPNLYRLVLKDRKQTSTFLPEKPEADFRLSDQKTGKKQHEKPERDFLQNLLREPISTAADASPAIEGPENDNPRAQLFGRGLRILSGLTGRPESKLRSILGKWLKQSDDDAKRVLRAIEDARDENPAEPIAWIERALQARGPKQSSPDRSFLWGRH
jgi:DNA-binding MarR family transcriptional regulator